MHVQAPTLSVSHRAQVLSALAAIAVAGGAYGVIAIATNDDESTKSTQAPVVSKVDSTRVLDGSAILRGTANRVDTSRVLDGSAILRGTANRVDTSRVLDGSPILRGAVASPAVTAVPHPRLDGGPFLPKSGLPKDGNAQPTALQPPKGQPEGFHGH
jgi:hypothetical protein